MNWAALRPSKAQVVSLVAFVLSGAMLGVSVYMVYSIDVLKSWTLELPKQEIHVGDEIVVASVYNKVRDVTGIAERSLDCKNKDGIFIRYPLNKAVANRAARMGGTGIVVIMPKVPNLPTKCKVSVAIKYEVLKIGDFVVRTVQESNETKEFILRPALGGASPRTTPVQVSTSGVLSPEFGTTSYASSLNGTPILDSLQSNSSQLHIIARILAPTTNLLGRN